MRPDLQEVEYAPPTEPPTCSASARGGLHLPLSFPLSLAKSGHPLAQTSQWDPPSLFPPCRVPPILLVYTCPQHALSAGCWFRSPEQLRLWGDQPSGLPRVCAVPQEAGVSVLNLG